MQPAGDHAPGVGLHGDHSPEAMTESLAHQVGAAAGLEPDDAPAGQAVLLVQLPGAVQGLQPQEAQPHLQGWPPAQNHCPDSRPTLPVEVTAPGSTLQPACPEGTAVSSQTEVSQGVALAFPEMQPPQETPILRPGMGLLPVHLPSPKASSFTEVHVTHPFLAPSEVFNNPGAHHPPKHSRRKAQTLLTSWGELQKPDSDFGLEEW